MLLRFFWHRCALERGQALREAARLGAELSASGERHRDALAAAEAGRDADAKRHRAELERAQARVARLAAGHELEALQHRLHRATLRRDARPTFFAEHFSQIGAPLTLSRDGVQISAPL